MRRHHQSTATRWGRQAALTVLVLAVALLALPMAATGAGADTGTYVRLAQLSPDMSGVTISISSVGDAGRDIMLPGEAYGGLSAYQRIEPGDYVVAVRAKDSASPVVSSALKAVSGSSYTLAATGAGDKRALSVFTDDLTAPPAGRARVRVINAAPPAPVLDVRGPGGSPFSSGLPLSQVSGYRTVDAGTLPLSAGPPGGMNTDFAVPVGPNQVISVVLVSDGARIAAQPHVDAAGPGTVPPGSMAAGYGGAADPHGPLSELLLGGVALGAGIASVVLSRRGRRSPSRAC
ncbi:MAG TPA: DUF4397 domain-containing protein [Pseudonocardia sp.]